MSGRLDHLKNEDGTIRLKGMGCGRHRELLGALNVDLPRWDRFVRRVLQEQRPALTFPAVFRCDLEPGNVIDLKVLKALGNSSAAQVSITVTRVLRGKKGEWLIEYRLRDDRPRFPHRDSSKGYTRNPELALMREEAIEPDLQEQYTAEGWERHALRMPELEERLKVVRAEARAKGIDSSRLDASIERRIQAYERRVRAA